MEEKLAPQILIKSYIKFGEGLKMAEVVLKKRGITTMSDKNNFGEIMELYKNVDPNDIDTLETLAIQLQLWADRFDLFKNICYREYYKLEEQLEHKKAELGILHSDKNITAGKKFASIQPEVEKLNYDWKALRAIIRQTKILCNNIDAAKRSCSSRALEANDEYRYMSWIKEAV